MPQGVTAATAAPTSAAPRATRRLMPTEMAGRRRQGLCYNCVEQYVPGHRCACLFSIELDDFAPEDAPLEEDPESPHISLHAITGLWSMRVIDTIQLLVVIGTHTFTALLDTGSTHSFIDS
uniref:Uncharacterized protein n=1 Tax=Aegilops tauschii subsp. strangulata TaxID=200361 RepID=A0A452Y8N6_AEGTS